MLDRKSSRFIALRNVFILAVLVSLCFFFFFRFISPVNVNNMGGMHSWLSGSTIKFVNNWLEEGPERLNFTNYEAPNSIEFETLEEREPYLSYPTGETFFVYITAKVMGKSRITVSFLHKFQLIIFSVEAILFSVFVYLFLAKTVKLRSNCQKIIIAFFVAVLWMLLPTCSYYLANIYYADQSVIFWVMGIMLVEYVIRVFNLSKKWSRSLKCLRAALIYTGLLVDYYFWFLALFLFIFEMLDIFVRKKKGERKKEIIGVLMWFGIPAVLAVLTYYMQLVQTSGWMKILSNRFNVRVAGREIDTLDVVFSGIVENFVAAFSLHHTMSIYLGLISVAIIVIGCVAIVKEKKYLVLIRNPGISIVVANILAIISQIFFFKQHSAIHEFSMIKVGWVIALLPIIITMVICCALKLPRGYRKNVLGVGMEYFSLCFIPSFLIIIILVGVPASTIEFTEKRVAEVKYDFEEMINEETNYSDVLFSYTDEILKNPPQQLAISNKLLYKIDDVLDIDEIFPNLSLEATKILVVVNNKDLPDAQKKQLSCLKNKPDNIKRYEDNEYLLLEMNDVAGCETKKK